MKLTQENINEILQMDLEQSYKFYTTLILEEPKLKKYYFKIRYGILIMFDIHDIFDNYLETKPKKGLVRVRGKTVYLDDYRTEIENREAMLKKVVLDHVTEKNNIYKTMTQT